MYFYRHLYPIFALSFDLDDTLYNNRPVIAQAERKSLLFLRTYHPLLRNIRQIDCNRYRYLLFNQNPSICHNVTNWRWKSLELMLYHLGLSKIDARVGADFAMDIIIRWRSCVNISVHVHNILLELSSRWPLVAITNGNIDLKVCGLSEYFTYVFRAGRDGKSKPYEDMYCLASKKLGLPCKYFLHVGDNLKADVRGAIFSGMQSCWISEYINNLSPVFITDMQCVPHIQIASLLSLTSLL